MITRIVRGTAGTLILASILLAYFVDARWLWLTGFVGVNLLQAAFTNWCPAASVLKKLGVKGDSCNVNSSCC